MFLCIFCLYLLFNTCNCYKFYNLSEKFQFCYKTTTGKENCILVDNINIPSIVKTCSVDIPCKLTLNKNENSFGYINDSQIIVKNSKPANCSMFKHYYFDNKFLVFTTKL